MVGGKMKVVGTKNAYGRSLQAFSGPALLVPKWHKCKVGTSMKSKRGVENIRFYLRLTALCFNEFSLPAVGNLSNA